MPRRAIEPDHFPFFDYRRFTFSLGIAAGDSVWLSGNTAAQFDAQRRAMVVQGDLLAQARVIFDKFQAVLVAERLELSHIYRMVRYVTPAALRDLDRLDEWQQTLVGDAPARSTVVVRSLLRPEALIEIEAVARKDGAATIEYPASVFAADSDAAWTSTKAMLDRNGIAERQVLRTAEFVTPGIEWTSSGITSASSLKVGSPQLSQNGAGAQVDIAAATNSPSLLLFVSMDGDGALDGVVDQTRDIYRRIEKRLRASGTTLDAVVKTTEFITAEALADYRKTADVRREIFAAPYPAATGVICVRLPDPRMMIAVEAVASLELQ